VILCCRHARAYQQFSARASRPHSLSVVQPAGKVFGNFAKSHSKYGSAGKEQNSPSALEKSPVE
jgi:hypothetical protein